MKKIFLMLGTFVMLCGMWIIPVNAEGDEWEICNGALIEAYDSDYIQPFYDEFNGNFGVYHSNVGKTYLDGNERYDSTFVYESIASLWQEYAFDVDDDITKSFQKEFYDGQWEIPCIVYPTNVLERAYHFKFGIDLWDTLNNCDNAYFLLSADEDYIVLRTYGRGERMPGASPVIEDVQVLSENFLYCSGYLENIIYTYEPSSKMVYMILEKGIIAGKEIVGYRYLGTTPPSDDLMLKYGYNESNISVELNGSKIHFDQTPILYNECTLVPMRAIFEVLGAEVTWDGNTQTVTAKRDNKTVKITIGDSFFYINGRKTKLEAPAMLVNDTTLVPVRAVSEAFNCRVDWDGENKTVLIKSNVAAKNSKMIEKLFEYDDTIKNEGNFDKTVIINDSVYHIKSEQIYNGDPEDIFKIEINGTAVNNNAYFGITDAYLVDLNPTDGCVELLISTFGDSAIIDLKAFQFDNGEIRTLKFVNSYNWFNENTSYLYVGSNYNGIEMNDDNSITLTTRTNSWGMWGVRTTFRLNENNEIEQEIQDKYDVDLDEFMDNDIMANHGNGYSREEYNMYRKHYALCKKSYGVLNKGDYFTILYDDNCGNIFVKTLSGKSGWINIRSVPYNERESISKLMFYLAS